MSSEERASARQTRVSRRRRAARLVRLAVLLGFVATAGFAAYRAVERPARRPSLPTPPGLLAVATPATPLDELAEAAGLARNPIPHARIVVDKSAMELRFYAGERRLKAYPVALGFGGLGDKQRRDDGCTPEGEFVICERTAKDDPRRWGDVFMRLNYPLPEDAERGLAAGLIDQTQRDAIVAAGRRGETPLQDTRLGSGIAIHIGGVRPRDWTEGCVSLEREDGAEVCRQVRVGTPVTVQR